MSENQSVPENAAGSDPDMAKFVEVTSGIYKRFDAESVATALRFAVRHQLSAENPTIMLMFVRIAEVYPEAFEFLQAQQDQATGPDRQAIDLILNPPEEIRGAKYLPESIQSPGEMDLCWAEFLVTGEVEVVDRIVSVLDRDDRTRRFLQDQLSDPSSDFSLSESEKMGLQAFGIGIGKGSDDGDWEVMTPGDCDLFIWLGVKDQNPICTRVLQAMDEPLQLHLAVKGAAMWSLQANASQHGKIRLLCDEAAKQEGGFGRTLLAANA